MTKVSILVPSRNEHYLANTIDDIFAKAVGDIEVIVILDGPTEFSLPKERPNLTFLSHPIPRGKQVCITHASTVARGKYLMWVDAHCAFSKGFDEEFQHNCDGDWVVIPRYYVLDPKLWERRPHRVVDYFYMAVPWEDPENITLKCCSWTRRTLERQDRLPIDDTMSIPGSLTFMSAEHFRKRIGGLETPWCGVTSTADWLDVVMKTWLGGGRVVVNKNVWYAHMNVHRRRGYAIKTGRAKFEYAYSSRYWLENRWEGRVHDFSWLVEKFWPLPTAKTRMRGEKYVWPENWRDYYEGMITYPSPQ